MPMMILRAADSTFESTSALEFDTLEDAYQAAVRAGLEIAAAEIANGASSAIVHVSAELQDFNDNSIAGAVAISTARLAQTCPTFLHSDGDGSPQH